MTVVGCDGELVCRVTPFTEKLAKQSSRARADRRTRFESNFSRIRESIAARVQAGELADCRLVAGTPEGNCACRSGSVSCQGTAQTM